MNAVREQITRMQSELSVDLPSRASRVVDEMPTVSTPLYELYERAPTRLDALGPDGHSYVPVGTDLVVGAPKNSATAGKNNKAARKNSKHQDQVAENDAKKKENDRKTKEFFIAKNKKRKEEGQETTDFYSPLIDPTGANGRWDIFTADRNAAANTTATVPGEIRDGAAALSDLLSTTDEFKEITYQYPAVRVRRATYDLMREKFEEYKTNHTRRITTVFNYGKAVCNRFELQLMEPCIIPEFLWKMKNENGINGFEERENRLRNDYCFLHLVENQVELVETDWDETGKFDITREAVQTAWRTADKEWNTMVRDYIDNEWKSRRGHTDWLSEWRNGMFKQMQIDNLQSTGDFYVNFMNTARKSCPEFFAAVDEEDQADEAVDEEDQADDAVANAAYEIILSAFLTKSPIEFGHIITAICWMIFQNPKPSECDFREETRELGIVNLFLQERERKQAQEPRELEEEQELQQQLEEARELQEQQEAQTLQQQQEAQEAQQLQQLVTRLEAQEAQQLQELQQQREVDEREKNRSFRRTQQQHYTGNY